MKITLGEDRVLRLTYEHADPDFAQVLLMADMGATDWAFFNGLSGQVARLGFPGSKIDEGTSNFALSVIRG